MSEVWKDIAGYEGLYQVSDLGNIRSIERTVRRNGNSTKSLKSVPLLPLFQKNGYMFVTLSKDGKVKKMLVHRAVAFAFVANPYNKPEVNHINEDKTDNRALNLEWVTREENKRYGTRISRGVAHRDQTGSKNGMFGKKGSLNPNSRPILQFGLAGNFIQRFDSIKEAAEKTGSNASSISRVAKGLASYTNGFLWKYEENSN